jgi:hypothetical protein
MLLLIILLINNLFQTNINNDNNFEDTNNIIFREDIYTNNCKKISIDNYKDIYINLNNIEPLIFKVKNTITKDFFIKKIENFKLDFSVIGNSDIVINSILYKDYLNNNNNNNYEYIFHSLFLNPNHRRNINKFEENYKFINIIIEMIDIPNSKSINNLYRCDLFIGKKYTGTHFHNHLEAINYLVYGKKLWLIFPNSKKNIKYIESITSYPKKINTIDWLNINYNKLKKNIEDLYIFIQKENECVYIPLKYFHMVINLEDSGGIAYNFI